MFISSTLLRQGVCVRTIWIDVKLLWYAGGMAAVSLAMPTKLWDSAGRERGRTLPYLQYIYIVPPLGAYKSQLGGTYILSLLVYTVNVSCDLIYIYIYMLSHLFMFNGWCLLHDRDIPHQNSRSCFDSSVFLMSKSTRWHEPLEGTLWERTDPPIWLWIYTFIVSNSSK